MYDRRRCRWRQVSSAGNRAVCAAGYFSNPARRGVRVHAPHCQACPTTGAPDGYSAHHPLSLRERAGERANPPHYPLSPWERVGERVKPPACSQTSGKLRKQKASSAAGSIPKTQAAKTGRSYPRFWISAQGC